MSRTGRRPSKFGRRNSCTARPKTRLRRVGDVPILGNGEVEAVDGDK